ncbi:hypothetical protein CEUSTIGMA_g2957.t1 [Chlamydomonas eustigma]|uniref:Uncharacterized protein n=1 Tax=Chlamydomonas eustigma TaxID=1157962 RepID=A0A250WXG1_9CHLO|nr:hypothetical protein CEUSTIGMA_g2957.t1 [Chlamydomonas eustigma]|eukprot:GAX75514.1 hypothetical protein CEUSTIGMA_g2957.t1 [Chlamydomonas eustigma]
MSRLQELEVQLDEIGSRLSRKTAGLFTEQVNAVPPSSAGITTDAAAFYQPASAQDEVFVIQERAMIQAKTNLREQLLMATCKAQDGRHQDVSGYQSVGQNIMNAENVSRLASMSPNLLRSASDENKCVLSDITCSVHNNQQHFRFIPTAVDKTDVAPSADYSSLMRGLGMSYTNSFQPPPAADMRVHAITWEGQRAAALLALEEEKQILSSQLQDMAAVQRASQQELCHVSQVHKCELEEQSAMLRKEILELNLRHQKEVLQAAGTAGQKLEELQVNSWQLFIRQRSRKLAACAFFLWRRLSVQSRMLARAESVWTARMLGVYFSEWYLYACSVRHNRAQAIALEDREARTEKLMDQRSRLFRLSHLISAWQICSSELRRKRRLYLKADRHWWRVLTTQVLGALEIAVQDAPLWKQILVTSRVKAVRLRQAFRAWVQMRRLNLIYLRNLSLRCLKSWQQHVEAQRRLTDSIKAVQHQWRCRIKAAMLYAWSDMIYTYKKERICISMVEDKNRSRLERCFIERVRSTSRHLRLVKRSLRARTRRIISLWQRVVQRESRNRRVCAAHRGVSLSHFLRAVIFAWRLQSAAATKRLQHEELLGMQSKATQLQYDLKAAELLRVAAREAMSAIQKENQELRVEAKQHQLLLAPDGFLGKALKWRSLPPDQDASLPASRSRHLTFFLPAIQGLPVTDPVQGADLHQGANVPLLSSTLVVMGGVGEDSCWLNDVHILTVNRTVEGSVKTSWAVPTMDWDLSNMAHIPRYRDHAGCECGPGQVLMYGGFDGQEELSTLHLYSFSREGDVCSHEGHVQPSYTSSWQLIQPRNRPPPARSHHSMTYHKAGRMALVFGGYSSAGGGLTGELWAFSLDLMEWSQPVTFGDAPAARRGHVSAVVAGLLVLHGGVTHQGQHLSDTWALDLESRQWTLLKCTGIYPGARRGHACAVVAERYLVIHGGYNGTQLLSDAHVLDLRTTAWTGLEVSGALDDQPSPCSHHTLTSTEHACILLGGSSALGPCRNVFLLESPAVTSGLQQQHQLLEVRQALTAEQGRSADLRGKLHHATMERERIEAQQQVIQSRTSQLTANFNKAAQSVSELKSELFHAEACVAESTAAQRDLELRVAAYRRKLERARQGGRLAAVEAENIYNQLQEARSYSSVLEGSLEQALAAAHDAQAVTLQISGERQALQMQLAAGGNELGVLRQMVAAVEKEHREAVVRIQQRADEEVKRVREQAMEELKGVMGAAAVETEWNGPGSETTVLGVQEDICGQNPDSAQNKESLFNNLRSRGGDAVQGMSSAVVGTRRDGRAEHILELRDYTELLQELAQARMEASKEAAAHQAAKRAASDAVEDLHRMEFRYKVTIEQLEQQVRQMQRSRWREEIKEPGASSVWKGDERLQLVRHDLEGGGGNGGSNNIQHSQDKKFVPRYSAVDEEDTVTICKKDLTFNEAQPSRISDLGVGPTRVGVSGHAIERGDTSDGLYAVNMLHQAASVEIEGAMLSGGGITMPHYNMLLQMRSNMFQD